MKNTYMNKFARLAGLGFSIVLTAGMVSMASGETLTGKGGAKLLTKPQAPVTASAMAKQSMACAQCKDQLVQRRDLSARGANKPVVNLVRHLCPGCETKSVLIGQGKAKHDAVTHTCTSSGAKDFACCAK